MRRPEEILQQAVVRFLTVSCPSVVFYHVPNQRGTRKGWEQGLLTSMGLTPGVADLCLVLPGGRAAFIELKAPKGTQTPDQTTFETRVLDLGAPYAVCRSVDDVQETLLRWCVPLRGRLT